jgi:Mlc titration factor MtfA (ptsG expression regulator)
MLFSWLKRRRRQRLLAEPFPTAWLGCLEANFAHYHLLTSPERAKLRDDLRVLIAEKGWEGCGGQEVTDEVKVTVATQAALLVLGMKESYFDRVVSVLIYPRSYLAPRSLPVGGGVALEGEVAVEGQAHDRGPVILSWQEVLAQGRDPGAGRNLVFHEFAHQLDMEDGAVNGTPPLADAGQARRWQQVLGAEHRRLVEDAAQGRPTLLDAYGATSPGEFFAVSTECFFTRPEALRRRHRALYEALRDYYRQDTAERARRAGRCRPVGAFGECAWPEDRP